MFHVFYFLYPKKFKKIFSNVFLWYMLSKLALSSCEFLIREWYECILTENNVWDVFSQHQSEVAVTATAKWNQVPYSVHFQPCCFVNLNCGFPCRSESILCKNYRFSWFGSSCPSSVPTFIVLDRFDFWSFMTFGNIKRWNSSGFLISGECHLLYLIKGTLHTQVYKRKLYQFSYQYKPSSNLFTRKCFIF